MVVNLSYQVFSTEAAAAAQDARDCFTLPREQDFYFLQRGVRGSCFRVIQRFQTNMVILGAFEMTFFILSINIASVGTVL